MQLAPFNTTTNSGGEYKVWLIQYEAAGTDSNGNPIYTPVTDNSGNPVVTIDPNNSAVLHFNDNYAKTDNFKVKEGSNVNPNVGISGYKFYDANGNGTFDSGESGIGGWTINLYVDTNQNGVLDSADPFYETTTTSTTTPNVGAYGFTDLLPGDYIVAESTTPPANLAYLGTWQNVTPTSVAVDISSDGTVTPTPPINFGNVALGGGGGLTLGYWSNKNGENVLTGSKTGQTINSGALAALSNLNLVDASGITPNWLTSGNYSDFRTWLLDATATNMSYMLSVQLATMELNVYFGEVNGDSLVYAPELLSFIGSGYDTTGLTAYGFFTINDLMTLATNALADDGNAVAGDPARAYQQALMDTLDNANNNLTFVQQFP